MFHVLEFGIPIRLRVHVSAKQKRHEGSSRNLNPVNYALSAEQLMEEEKWNKG